MSGTVKINIKDVTPEFAILKISDSGMQERRVIGAIDADVEAMADSGDVAAPYHLRDLLQLESGYLSLLMLLGTRDYMGIGRISALKPFRSGTRRKHWPDPASGD